MSKSPSLRRIKADIRELSLDPSDRYHAAPLEDDMFEWHFTIRGADDTEFEGGIYHGRILLPAEYPFKPPHIVFLTPSGRFETGTKVCLSFSAYHPELWQPAWGIRLILEALISFLPTPGDGAIGSLDWTKEERKRLAKKSVNFCCPRCGNVAELLPKIEGKPKAQSKSRFQKEIEQLHALQIVNEAKKGEGNATDSESKGGESEAKKSAVEDDEKDEASEEGSANNKSTPQLVEEVKKKAAGSDGSAKEKPTEEEKDKSGDDNAPDEPDSRRAEPAETVNGPAQTEQMAGLVDERAPVNEPDYIPPWFTDSVVHAGIVTFAGIIYILYYKILALLEELRSLS